MVTVPQHPKLRRRGDDLFQTSGKSKSLRVCADSQGGGAAKCLRQLGLETGPEAPVLGWYT